MRYILTPVFLFLALAGCSNQGPPTAGSTPVPVPSSQVLQPVKEVAKEVEDAGLKFQESREKNLEKALEQLDEESEALDDAYQEARQRHDWDAVKKACADRIVKRKEYLTLVTEKDVKKKMSRAHTQMGRAYLANGQYAQAEDQWLKAVHTSADESQKRYARRDLFRLYTESRNWDKAASVASKGREEATSKHHKRNWTIKMARLDIKLEKFADARKKLADLRAELGSEEETEETLEQIIDTWDIEGDLAWADDDREAATKAGVQRAEFTKKRYELKLKNIQKKNG